MEELIPTENPENKPQDAGPMSRSFGFSKKTKIIIIGATIFVLLISNMLTAPAGFPAGGSITVENGESLTKLGKKLAEDGYIKSPFAFVTLATFFGVEHSLSVGDYVFDEPQSVVHVAWQIANGNHNIRQIKITIPEGQNVREIAGILSQKLPHVARSEFTEKATPLEGYLFPETYFVYPNETVDGVIEKMQTMFEYKTKGLFTPDALSGRSIDDVLTMASLIEREAHGSDDRALIAGILYNRLRLGMRLQVDATVAYANSIPEAMLQKKYFSIDSPYNTYLYAGLPPKPIANAGLDALRAALYPAKTDYLYYLHDSHGSIHYAKTYAEHQANVRKYLR